MGQRGRPRYPDILTPREWEVLALVRDGLTNEQIAERLGVSFSTARYHVSEILSKLGVSTREEAAAWRPPEERREWWRLAWPLTAAKAAGVALAAAVLVGLGVLAWGVLQAESGAGEQNRSGGVGTTTWQLLNEGLPGAAGSDRGDDPTSGDGVYVLDLRTGSETWLGEGRHPSWSSEGDTIAFLEWRQTLGMGGDGYVYFADPEGQNMRLVYEYVWGDVVFCSLGVEQSWSPDGKRLALSLGAGPTGLIIEATGEVYELTERLGCGLRWSPVDNRLAYSYSPSGGSYVHVVDVDSGVEEVVAEGRNPVWSTDGTRLAYLRNGDLYVARDDGRDERRIVSIEEDELLTYQTRLSWSPDGSRILTTRFESGQRDDQIIVVNIANGGVTEIAHGSFPEWSPDGSAIAYESGGMIYAVDPISGNTVEVVDGHHLSWSPDGTRIAFDR